MQRLSLYAGLGLAAGGVFTVLFFPPFDSPASDASAAAFTAYYEQERSEILFWCWLSVASTSLLLAPFVAFRNAFREHAPELAAVGLVASVGTVVLTIAGFATLAAVAYGGGEGEAARQLSDLGWMQINLAAGPPTAVSITAFTVAGLRSPWRHWWLVAIGAVAALGHLAVAASFADSGFFSPEGGIAQLVPCLWLLWIGATCAALLRRLRPGE